MQHAIAMYYHDDNKLSIGLKIMLLDFIGDTSISKQVLMASF